MNPFKFDKLSISRSLTTRTSSNVAVDILCVDADNTGYSSTNANVTSVRCPNDVYLDGDAPVTTVPTTQTIMNTATQTTSKTVISTTASAWSQGQAVSYAVLTDDEL
jgi:hypothetical protein